MYELNNSIILMDIHTIKHNKYYCFNANDNANAIANAIKHYKNVNICAVMLHSFLILPVVEGPRGGVARTGGIW